MESKSDPSNQPPKSPSVVKGLFKTFFNYRAWIDWDRSQSMYQYFLNIFKNTFVPQKMDKSKVKDFNQVVLEMQLSENDLLLKMRSFKRLCFLMVGMAFVLYAYSMYQMLYGSALGVILSLILMLVCLTLAFRYHFWYFQVKSRKLGCGIKEWFKESFMGGNQ